jgi:hypothetical protein
MRFAARSAQGRIKEAMPDRIPKPPGRAPGEPIIIKVPSRPPEVPEIDGSLEDEDDLEIRTPPGIVPEMPPPPRPEERATPQAMRPVELSRSLPESCANGASSARSPRGVCCVRRDAR